MSPLSPAESTSLRNLIEGEYTADQYLDRANLALSLLRRHEKQGDLVMRRKDLGQQLLDEMFPIGYFCQHYIRPSPERFKVRLKIGSQTGDATVVDERNLDERIDAIEVTCVETDEYILREKLNDPKSKGVVSYVRDTKWYDELVAALQRCLKKKSRPGSKYPDRCVLVVFAKDEDAERLLKEKMHSFLRDDPSLMGSFQSVHLVGRKSILYSQYRDADPLSSAELDPPH